MKTHRITPRQARADWEQFYQAWTSNAEIAPDEPQHVRLERRRLLEADPEAWFAYYFARYCSSKPAPFHRRATRKLIADPNAYHVRAWSRELAKSARSMMELAYLALSGQIRNVLVVSNSYDNACRLLAPLRHHLQHDLRIANDYGQQPIDGRWEVGEFAARCGCSFRAIGAGQSPRGSRNNESRPDFILIDDLDTDELCRNPDRLDQLWQWVEQALIPTRSISAPCRILFNGNIIARDCCIQRAIKMANFHEVVNIRNKDGLSSWPEKNSEADIDRILSQISARAAQQEYFNNPIAQGEVFPEMVWGKCPPVSKFRMLVAYGDPAPSENKSKQSSTKGVVLCGLHKDTLYVLNARLDRGLNAEFIDWFAELDEFAGSSTTVYNVMENNKLQDPFYRQVFLPLVAQKRRSMGQGSSFNVQADAKKKTDKATRIEANLEPLVRTGRLILNIDQQDNPHMRRLEEQFLMFSLQMRYPADGPDCVEGALRWLRDKTAQATPTQTISTQTIRSRNKQRL